MVGLVSGTVELVWVQVSVLVGVLFVGCVLILLLNNEANSSIFYLFVPFVVTKLPQKLS